VTRFDIAAALVDDLLDRKLALPRAPVALASGDASR
jgi:hypothetical protein